MAVNSDNILKRKVKLDANNNLKEITVPSGASGSGNNSDNGDRPSFGLHVPMVTHPADGNTKPRSSRLGRSGPPSPAKLRPDSPHPLPMSARSHSLRPWSSSSGNSRQNSSHPTPETSYTSTNYISSTFKKPNSKRGEKKKVPESKTHPAVPSKAIRQTSGTMKVKKKVSFAPDVVVHERENKPPRASNSKRALAPFGDRNIGFFIPPASELVRCPSPIPNRHIDPVCTSDDEYTTPNTFDRNIEENDYVKFTHIWRTPNMESRKNDDKCIVRLKRIHNIMTDLTDSHSLYRYIPESIKTKFLQEEILPRYAMALDLVLTESLLGVAIAIINTIRETVGFLHKMFYGEFFDSDHSALSLPSVLESGADYVDKVAPIIFTLNRISGEHSRSDSSYMSKETACTKLMLELMALTVLPVNSVMFRCVLGIIPDTANNCIKYLSEVQDEALLGWVNNSVMRREYMICMIKLSLADEFGAKAVLPALSLATIYAMSANNASKNTSKNKPKHRSKANTIGTPPSTPKPSSSQQ